MHVWILLVSLAASAEPLEGGSLLFLENCSSVVQRATHGSVGHVAIIMQEGTESWVYEATPGKVRKLTVAAYYDELSRLNARTNEEEQIRAFALRPEKPYTNSERQAMRHYLDEQIGRRYSVKGYVKGRDGDGIHCAELASHALNESGRFKFENCHSINPSRLQELVDPAYGDATQVELPVFTAEESWCQKAQNRWNRFHTWCGWSCGEAWAFWRN